MTLTLNGSTNTISGLAVGGLPDGIVDTDMIAANAVTIAKAAGSVKGITMVDTFRNTTSVSGDQNPLGNFERSDDATSGFIGTGMTYSSGIFTFPQTGIYLCEFQCSSFLSGDEREIQAMIHVSSDSGSNYDEVGNSRMHIKQTESTNTHSCCIASSTVDVTNASNFRVKAKVDTGGSNVFINGNTNADETYFRFIRLGDT